MRSPQKSLGYLLRFLRRLGADEILHQRIDHGAHRHAQQHTQHAEHSAADGHRRQHPQSRQTHGLAHHPGVDEVALHLLQNQQEDQEGQRLDGADKHDEERTRGRADPRAEDGDEGGEADDHRHRQGIGQPQNQHTQAAQGAQNERLRHLAGDKAGKGVVGELEDVHGALARLLGQDGQQQAFGLGKELLLLRQHIHGEHQRQQDIHQRAQNGGGDVDGGVHHIAAVAGEELGDELGGVLHIHGQLRQRHAVLLGKGGQVRPPFLDLGDVVGHIGHQGGARLLQPGDEDEDNGEDDAQKQQDGDSQADGALELHPPQLRRLFQRQSPQPLNGLEQQVHYIGNAHADEQRGEQGEKAAQHLAQGGQVVQRPV